MKKYLVVRLKGKQYKVSESDEFLVDKITGDDISPEILLSVNEDKVKVGKPILKDVKLSLKISETEFKGKKVDIFKYKSKSRYRKHLGFRPKYTKLLVEKID